MPVWQRCGNAPRPPTSAQIRVMPASRDPVWRLHRPATGTDVECRIEQTVSKTFIVTVISGAAVFLDEVYPDATSARSRALLVRDGLLASGDWTSVTVDDAN